MAWYSRERSSFKSSARRSREISPAGAADFGSDIVFSPLKLSETVFSNYVEPVFYYLRFIRTMRGKASQNRNSGQSSVSIPDHGLHSHASAGAGLSSFVVLDSNCE